jgi:hypothetical protein
LEWHGQFEKYDAGVPGRPGGDGEYPVQTGFGWSNGVVLMLLEEYGWHPELDGTLLELCPLKAVPMAADESISRTHMPQCTTP